MLRDGKYTLFDQPYPFPAEKGMDPLVVEYSTVVDEHNLTLSLISDSEDPNALMHYNRSVTFVPGQAQITTLSLVE